MNSGNRLNARQTLWSPFTCGLTLYVLSMFAPTAYAPRRLAIPGTVYGWQAALWCAGCAIFPLLGLLANLACAVCVLSNLAVPVALAARWAGPARDHPMTTLAALWAAAAISWWPLGVVGGWGDGATLLPGYYLWSGSLTLLAFWVNGFVSDAWGNPGSLPARPTSGCTGAGATEV